MLNDPKSKTPAIVQAVAKTASPAAAQPIDKTAIAATSAAPANNALALVQTGPSSTFQQTAKVEKPFYKKFLPFGDDAQAATDLDAPTIAQTPVSVPQVPVPVPLKRP